MFVHAAVGHLLPLGFLLLVWLLHLLHLQRNLLLLFLSLAMVLLAICSFPQATYVFHGGGVCLSCVHAQLSE